MFCDVKHWIWNIMQRKIYMIQGKSDLKFYAKENIFECREIQIWNLMVEKHISNVGKVRSGILLQSNNFYDVKQQIYESIQPKENPRPRNYIEPLSYFRSKHIDNINKTGYEQEKKNTCIKLRVNYKLYS